MLFDLLSSCHLYKENCSVADPDPGSGPFLTPGSGMGRKSASGIRDEQPRSYFLELRNRFFFDADPGSGMEKSRIRDPGREKVGSGIRNKHPGSATLENCLKFETVKPGFLKETCF
jgi:hypothetical protein